MRNLARIVLTGTLFLTAVTGTFSPEYHLNRELKPPPKEIFYYIDKKKITPLTDFQKPRTIEEYIDRIYNPKKAEIPFYISKEFIMATIKAESGDINGNNPYPRAVGKANERGLMQITPWTWWQVEKKSNFYEQAFDPQKNIEVGITHILEIDKLCRKYHPRWKKLNSIGKIEIIAAAYNAGIPKLRSIKWDLTKLSPITKKYIERIKRFLKEEYFKKIDFIKE